METISDTFKTELVPIEIEYRGEKYSGEANPIMSSCKDGICFELDITLNNVYMGTIHRTKGGWTMDKIVDQGFIDALGQEISLWYEMA